MKLSQTKNNVHRERLQKDELNSLHELDNKNVNVGKVNSFCANEGSKLAEFMQLAMGPIYFCSMMSFNDFYKNSKSKLPYRIFSLTN